MRARSSAHCSLAIFVLEISLLSSSVVNTRLIPSTVQRTLSTARIIVPGATLWPTTLTRPVIVVGPTGRWKDE